MSPKTQRQEHTPASVKQVAAAMAALGAYTGDNTPAEHAAEAARLGGADAYRVRLVNALLGVVPAQAVLADAFPWTSRPETPPARNICARPEPAPMRWPRG